MALPQEKFTSLPPVIEFSTTQQYYEIWNDKGSRADMDGAFYRPIPQEGFFILGDYGQGNYDQPSEAVLTIRVKDNDDSENPALVAPDDFVLIWNDMGSGADENGSVWAPVVIKPGGYVACGHVFQKGYEKPSLNSPGLDKLRCLRYDLATQVDLGGLIWNDQGSRADMDVAVYRTPQTNVIFAVPSYDPPTQMTYIPSPLTQ